MSEIDKGISQGAMSDKDMYEETSVMSFVFEIKRETNILMWNEW